MLYRKAEKNPAKRKQRLPENVKPREKRPAENRYAEPAQNNIVLSTDEFPPERKGG